MTLHSFHTIAAPAEGVFKEKGSKFIAFAFPVASEQEVKVKLEGLKKEYFDARHHCYAYVLGPPESKFRAFDAGEPNHSAGDPILGKIRSKGLTNVLVVVVRYFGGVKLGVGGLVQAYKASAEAALSNAVVIETEFTEKFRLTYDFAATPEIMRLIKEFECKIVSQDFGERGVMDVVVRSRVAGKFLERVNVLKDKGVGVIGSR